MIFPQSLLRILVLLFSVCIVVSFQTAGGDMMVDNFDDNNLTSEVWGGTENNWAAGVDGQEGLGIRAANDTSTGLYLSGKDAGLVPFHNGYAYQMNGTISPYTALDPSHQIHYMLLGASHTTDVDLSGEQYIRFTAWYNEQPTTASIQDATFNVSLMEGVRICGPTSLCLPNMSTGPWNDDGTTISSVLSLSHKPISTTPQVFCVRIDDAVLFKIDPIYGNFLGSSCCSPAQSVDKSHVQFVQFGLRRASSPWGRTHNLGAKFAIDDILFIRRLPGYRVSEPTSMILMEGDAASSSTFTVCLASAPSHPVRLILSVNNPERLTVSPGSLIFTPPSATIPADPGDWMTTQTVEVRAVDGGVYRPEEGVFVMFTPDSNPPTSDELAYSALTIPPIRFSVQSAYSPTSTPTPEPTESATSSPSATPSLSPTESLSPTASLSPTMSLSPTSSLSPTVSPSLSPTLTESPSVSPTASPSASPTESPTIPPTESPTISPTESPSSSPSESPSATSSTSETETPSPSPTDSETPSPSVSPSLTPSISPTLTLSPSVTPSPNETVSPTPSSSGSPTPSPPTFTPSPVPSPTDSSLPSLTPTPSPTAPPSPTPEESPSTPTLTSSPTNSESPTISLSPTVTPSPSVAISQTPSLSVSPSPSSSPSPVATPDSQELLRAILGLRQPSSELDWNQDGTLDVADLVKRGIPASFDGR